MSEPIPTFDEQLDGPSPGKATKRGPGRPLPKLRNPGLLDAMIAIAVIAVLSRLAVVTGVGFALIMVVVFVIAMIAGGGALLLRGRSARAEPMLWVVANAVERGLPIEAGIEACGALCGVGMRLRARSVVRQIERGLPLAEAFSRVPGSFPRAGLVFLRMDWDGPRLGASLRDLIRRRVEWRPFQSTMAMRLAYLAWTLVVMQAIVAFLLYWVAPQMQAIFIDFGVELPAVTRWGFLIGSNPVISIGYVVGLLLQVLALPLLLFVFFDPIEWGIVPIDLLMIKRHGATVLRALAGEVSLDRPMPEALERIARAHPSRVVRRRIRRAKARVDRGQPWARSLSGVRLIRPADAAVLDAAQRLGNLSWALNDLADGLDRRSGYRMIALSQALFPVAVVAIAVPIALIAISYFLPLVTIIQRLAS